jgi:hypothetical protein
MEGKRMVKRVFLENPGGKRNPERPKLRWLDCVEKGLKILGVRIWRKIQKIVKNGYHFK